MNSTYVTPEGLYIGTWEDPLAPEDETLVNIGEQYPDYADQQWLFPGWGESRSLAESVENQWRAATLLVIARQLEAIEEDEVDETPADLLPGTRKQWLKFRGQVSNWNEADSDFPDIAKRPDQPS